MDRPTVIACETCGTDVEVGPRGTIPKYCPDHRTLQARVVYGREQAAAQGPDEDPDVETDGGETPDVRVCRPASCFIPLDDLWSPEFCPAHWRCLSTEVKGGLLAAERGTDAYDVQVFRALREISKIEGRSAYESDQTFEDASSGVS